MSMLKDVKSDLYANHNIVVVDIQVCNHITGGSNWTETVDIIVAPKKGIYDSIKLQTLLDQLTPSTKCTCQDRFREGDNDISIGVLYFDENVGIENVHREIVLLDEDLLARNFKGFTNGKQLIDEKIDMCRRTWVRLYPNVQIALQVANDGKNKYSIDKQKLLHSQGRFARLLSRLGCKP